VPAKTGRHRTWAYSRGLRQVGDWHVVVRDGQTGKELARRSLEITSSTVATETGEPSPKSVAEQPADKSAAAEAEMI
jgi:hypothetical protein